MESQNRYTGQQNKGNQKDKNNVLVETKRVAGGSSNFRFGIVPATTEFKVNTPYKGIYSYSASNTGAVPKIIQTYKIKDTKCFHTRLKQGQNTPQNSCKWTTKMHLIRGNLVRILEKLVKKKQKDADKTKNRFHVLTEG